MTECSIWQLLGDLFPNCVNRLLITYLFHIRTWNRCCRPTEKLLLQTKSNVVSNWAWAICECIRAQFTTKCGSRDSGQIMRLFDVLNETCSETWSFCRFRDKFICCDSYSTIFSTGVLTPLIVIGCVIYCWYSRIISTGVFTPLVVLGCHSLLAQKTRKSQYFPSDSLSQRRLLLFLSSLLLHVFFVVRWPYATRDVTLQIQELTGSSPFTSCILLLLLILLILLLILLLMIIIIIIIMTIYLRLCSRELKVLTMEIN